MAIKTYTDDDINLKFVDTVQAVPRTLDELSKGTNIDSPFTSGMIMLWSGAIVNIPAGWILCDGGGGSPDLRDNFVVGAGNTYAVDAVGGEATHVLTIAEMPAHTHNHPKDINECPDDAGPHDIIGDGANVTPTSSTGGGAAHNNLPPYYAIAYIMKT